MSMHRRDAIKNARPAPAEYRLHPLAAIIGRWAARSAGRHTFDVPALIAEIEVSDWLAAHVATARAEALREAADDVMGVTAISGGSPIYRSEVADWLRARADREATP